MSIGLHSTTTLQSSPAFYQRLTAKRSAPFGFPACRRRSRPVGRTVVVQAERPVANVFRGIMKFSEYLLVNGCAGLRLFRAASKSLDETLTMVFWGRGYSQLA
eukprot:1935218-Pyramimonas_sp.AAC.2